MFFLLFVLIISPYESPDIVKITSESAVEKVTVYPSGARLERTADVRLVRGKNEVTISPLQGNIDQESITVSAEGNLTVLSVIPVINFLQTPASTTEIERLSARKKDLEFRIEFQENLLYVLNQEEDALKENRRIDGNSQLTGILYLRDIMDFYRQRLTEISTKRLEIRREISGMNDELIRVSNQLANQQRGARQPVTEVRVLIESPVETEGRLKLSYFTSDAQWLPVYDIRVVDVGSTLRLQYKAGISQRTGENWNQVQIFLSSAAPLQGQQSPVLNPWRIDYQQNRSANVMSVNQDTRRLVRDGTEMRLSGIVVDATDNEPLAGANVVVPGGNIGTVTNSQGFFSLQVPSNTAELNVRYIGYETQTIPVRSNMLTIAMYPGRFELDEMVVSGSSSDMKQTSTPPAAVTVPVVQVTPLSFNFEVPARYTISGDGEDQQVTIHDYEINAEFNYLSIPKIEEKAWLQARISDWEKLNLLNGKANLFLGNTYLGSTRIDPASLSDTLALNLGSDESILVRRTKADQYSSRSFLGGRETQTLTWDIEIRNARPTPVSLRLTDQIPLSNRREISVDLTESGGALYNQETGELKWLVDLGPSQTRTIRFSYQVRYPRNERVILE
jgi:hypothetical protein